VADIGQRANRVLGKMRAIPGDIAIFSSGHFLRSFAARWLDMPVGFGEKLILDPASISILGFEGHTRHHHLESDPLLKKKKKTHTPRGLFLFFKPCSVKFISYFKSCYRGCN
jgi:broad specificity phosphatase PhoE